jgi:dTDP-4-amino-4,6-dideoxygalactose transaminase
MGKKFGGKPGDCPVTEDLSDRLVRLPFYTTMSGDDLERAIEEILSFRA